MNRYPDKREKNGKKLIGFLMVLFVLGLGIGIGTLISDRVDATAPPGDSRLEMQKNGKPVAGEDVLALSRAFEEVSNRLEPAGSRFSSNIVRRVGCHKSHSLLAR